jgi:ribosome-binding factor A
MSEHRRSARVASVLHEELSLRLRAMSDPRLTSIVVSRVEVSDDLSFARVLVMLGSHASGALPGEAERRGALRALAGVGPRLRRTLSRELGMKSVPELRFQYDEGFDNQVRVSELLREIADDERSKSGA